MPQLGKVTSEFNQGVYKLLGLTKNLGLTMVIAQQAINLHTH